MSQTEILIVDDDEKVLFVLEETLKRGNKGYEIDTASKGTDAVKIAQERPLNLLITDMLLEDTNGIKLTEEIKAVHPHIPVIWITAYGCHTVARHARKLEVYQCLNKPIEIRQLRQVVEKALANGGPGNDDKNPQEE